MSTPSATSTPPTTPATPSFRTAMTFEYGVARQLMPGVARLVANNPSPFTYKGTNTYVVGAASGTGAVAVIDPGPHDDAHLAALLAAIGDRRVTHAVITHTHRDHVDGLAAFIAATGAKTAGYGRDDLPRYGGTALKPSGGEYIDFDFKPDVRLRDGDRIEGDGFALTALFTPGHAADHISYALDHGRALFSGDHVMAWNTTVIAPPEGNMAHYYSSLERLIGDAYDVYLPGHGGRLHEPSRMVRALLVHRRWREEAILAAIREDARAGRQTTIASIVALVYRGLDPRLAMAASLSVQAHVEHLSARGLVRFALPLTFDRPLSPA
jgi:glyoxylase-like metal-dependent hydrolase (beta-lactamase superfamily II)